MKSRRMAFATVTLLATLTLRAQPMPPDHIFTGDFDLHRPPVADAGQGSIASVGTPVLLDGSQSSDPDDDTLTYSWSVISRPPGSNTNLFDPVSATPALIADKTGDYVMQLIVSDGEFFSTPDTVSISASGNLEASAEIGPEGGAVGLPDGASVLIPPGALGTITTIGIATTPPPANAILPPTAVYVGEVYDLSPAGQSFTKPARISVPYNTALLPTGYVEGAISVYRQEGWPNFDMVGSEYGEAEPETSAQEHDADDGLLSVLSSGFSAYAALAIRSSTQFTPLRLAEATASVVVLGPPALRTQRPNVHNCGGAGQPDRTQGPLLTRAATAIEAIVLHSTNNGNATRDFEGELGWAGDDCNKFFAHYYVNRDGTIYQIVDDLRTTNHTRTSPVLGVNNSNSIGIEIFNSVGEPYDGRQLSAVTRLVDFLAEKYAIPRPSRDPTTGTLRRNRIAISAGGDRIVGHVDTDPSKCDPIGTFMDSGIARDLDVHLGCRHPTRVLPGGSSQAPALMDIVLDTISVLARERQHTGLVNTQGGDGFQLGQAADGGSLTMTENAALVAAQLGTDELTQSAENLPLIVAPGATSTLDGPGPHVYTDMLIAGTLILDSAVVLHLSGTFYLSPTGKIIARDGAAGADLTLYSRGTPIIEGLIDLRGDDGDATTPTGGSGGTAAFHYSAPGILLAPTAYTRGGDADTADVSLGGGGPRGGDGGIVTITVEDTHIFTGGGVGPIVGAATVPAWRSGTIDPALVTPPAQWSGDYLPPPPPFFLSTLGNYPPAAGERVPLTRRLAQVGFSRGFLTTGGMGGAGLASSAANQHGGPAGNGGGISVALGTNGVLSLRDSDFATGTEVETLTHRFHLPPPLSPALRLVCTASGAQGGFGANVGSHGGDGGSGGAAGAVSVTGGSLNPAPAQFVSRQTIMGFPSGQRLQDADNNCSTGSTTVGEIIEARDATGRPLYRVRVDGNGNGNGNGTMLLGGLGGIPSGRPAAGQPGNVGANGATAPISGLPVQ